VNHCKKFHKLILNYVLHNLASKHTDIQQSTQNRNKDSRETVAGQRTLATKANVAASVKFETASGGPTNTTMTKKETQIAVTHPSPTGDCHHGHSILVEANRNDVMKPTPANAVNTKQDCSQLEQVEDSQPKMKDNASDVSLFITMCLKFSCKTGPNRER